MPALFQVIWMNLGMILAKIVWMLLAGGVGIIIRLVVARDPGAEIDQLASLGAERAKAIRRRHVSRFFAIGTGSHRNSTREPSYDQNCKWWRVAQMRSAGSVAHSPPRYARRSRTLTWPLSRKNNGRGKKHRGTELRSLHHAAFEENAALGPDAHAADIGALKFRCT